MDNILEISGLNKKYSDFALKNISFCLPEGCITGFIGINGAGKTTTIRSILGLTNKISGNIKFFGTDMDGNENEIKDRIGIVLDEGCFYDELTLTEMKNVIAPAYKNWCEQDFIDYLERFSLNPKQKISTLSKGTRMKYALALALSHKAELLIMDEPTSGLDPLVRSQLLDILKDYMSKDGKGVFFSTHITSDLDKIADMLIMIHNGQIVFQEEKDQLLDSYRMIKGSTEELDESTRKYFLSIEENSFGFTGVTKQVSEVMARMQDVLAERPTLEDIMLANVEGGKKACYLA
ncbi:MAG: ABC transporter ATP-binding protein [Eubacteriales bacterium]|nr:ABC transporter ATP-binding protein [Eubacteriales bacterium]